MRRAVMAVLLVLVSSLLVVAGPAPGAAAWPSEGYSSDWDGDGANDVIVADLQGRLWLYPGNGYGVLGPRRQLGSGWQTFDEIRPVGDFNGDGNTDLVARDRWGDLQLHPGNGYGGFRFDGSQSSPRSSERAISPVTDAATSSRATVPASARGGAPWTWNRPG